MAEGGLRFLVVRWDLTWWRYFPSSAALSMLSGNERPERRCHSESNRSLTRNQAAVEQLELAESKGITTTQLALAWLLGHGDHMVPIPDTRGPQRTETSRG